MRAILFAASVLVFGGGCAKSFKSANNAGDNKTTSPRPKAQNLEGMNTAEVLKTKYKSAILTCSLWVQHGTTLNKSVTPNDSFSWNMMKDSRSPKSFKLSGQVEAHTYSLEMTVQSVEVQNTNYRNESGEEYKLEYSPVIQVQNVSSSRTEFEKGQYTAMAGGGAKSIFERIPEVLENGAEKRGASVESYFQYVECELDTVVKPEYADQFSKLSH